MKVFEYLQSTRPKDGKNLYSDDKSTISSLGSIEQSKDIFSSTSDLDVGVGIKSGSKTFHNTTCLDPITYMGNSSSFGFPTATKEKRVSVWPTRVSGNMFPESSNGNIKVSKFMVLHENKKRLYMLINLLLFIYV